MRKIPISLRAGSLVSSLPSTGLSVPPGSSRAFVCLVFDTAKIRVPEPSPGTALAPSKVEGFFLWISNQNSRQRFSFQQTKTASVSGCSGQGWDSGFGVDQPRFPAGLGELVVLVIFNSSRRLSPIVLNPAGIPRRA